MAQPQLRAKFFVAPDGTITIREKPLNINQRKEIYDRDGHKCKICNSIVMLGGNDVNPFMTIKSGHIDHKFAISRGGSNDPSNLQLLCMSCNSKKGAA